MRSFKMAIYTKLVINRFKKIIFLEKVIIWIISFYFVNNNDDSVIQASIWRKMKDYTKLLEHIGAVNNKCKN